MLHLACPLLIAAEALDTQRDNVRAFIDKMVDEHQLERGQLTTTLAQATSKESILKAMRRPAEKSKPWYEYRKIFINPQRINAGVKFWQTHAADIERVAQKYGVPAEIIVAILGVETHYGKLTGSYRVIDALATLAFDYPPRSTFFTQELGEFFLLAAEEDVDLLGATGSYAGAMGAPQFIPSSYRNYSTDGDADGKRDLFTNWQDIFASVAHYFIGHGWQPNGPVVSRASMDARVAQRLALDKILPVYRVGFLRSQGIRFDSIADDDALSMIVTLDGEDALESWVGYQNFYVITRYNRSKMYAMAVVQLAEAIKELVDDDR
ncbi:MAG: lytic murein transglycosylase B [Gammaproteobacteria bacterium]|nr:lytic murein transglycosylase B [Gammaproteobacteria bacterium]